MSNKTLERPRRICGASWLLPVLVAACQSAPPVSVEQEKMEERRILAPFSDGGTVACNELVVEMTSNFYPMVSQPAQDPKLHGYREERHGDYIEKVWFNKIGGYSGRFTVVIGPIDDPTEAVVAGPARAAGQGTQGQGRQGQGTQGQTGQGQTGEGQTGEGPGGSGATASAAPGIRRDKPARFTVVNKVVLRTYQVDRQMTLDVRASGPHLMMMTEASGQPVNLREYTASDGELVAIKALQ